MKKILITLFLIAALGAIVWNARRETPLEVTLHTIDRGTVELTVSNTRAGTVKACRRSALSMPIGGRVERLHVKEGEPVEAQQLLLELWNEDRRAMTMQAQSQLAAASHRREQLCVESQNAAREAKTTRHAAQTQPRLPGSDGTRRDACALGRVRVPGSQ